MYLYVTYLINESIVFNVSTNDYYINNIDRQTLSRCREATLLIYLYVTYLINESIVFNDPTIVNKINNIFTLAEN